MHETSHFRTTRWTLVVRAATTPDDLATLLQRYWTPIYAFLRARGNDHEHALDLTQGFMLYVIERGLLEKADQARGRFRSFLITCLKRFVIDQARKEGGRGGGRPKVAISADPDALRSVVVRAGDDPESVFTTEWARKIFERALQRLEHECCNKGMEQHWAVLERAYLRPILYGAAPVAIDELMEELSICDRQRVYDIRNLMKRNLRQVLCELVKETVEDPAEIEAELGELRRYLR